MQFPIDPLKVTCDSCGASGETYDGLHPDLAVTCDCCPIAHDHAGLGCRTVTIRAIARLSLLDISDLMDAMAQNIPSPAEMAERQ